MGGSVGVTATRSGATPQQLEALIRLLTSWEPDEVHHGDCVGGDRDAADVATGLGIPTVSHPPTNPALRSWHASTRTLPPEEYKDRNRAIVAASGVLIAIPKEFDEEKYGGTWSTVREARNRGRAVVLIYPDGTVFEERNRDPRFKVDG